MLDMGYDDVAHILHMSHEDLKTLCEDIFGPKKGCAFRKLNSMGGWPMTLSNYMGGGCLWKFNSMGGGVKKKCPPPSPPPPRSFFLE